MKKLITFLVFGASTVSANAQLITITETFQLPAFGDTVHYVDANSFGFDPVGTGPVTAKLWDNSALLLTGTTYDFYYVDPITITGSGVDSFPAATLARAESGAAGYFYYQNTINNINRIGWFGSASNFGIYENATFATEFHFPITAGQTFTSTYNGRYAPFNLGEDSVKIETGSLSINADMQGILMLPTGTFTGVLRLHVLESFHIKTYFLGVPALDNLVQDDYYYWFTDSILQPILVSGTTAVDGTVQNTVLRYQPITTPNSIAENSIGSTPITPNPSNGKFSIKNYNNASKDYTFEIYNVLGEKINYTETKQQASSEINLSNAPKGIYFVKIYNGENVRTEKIVIQ